MSNGMKTAFVLAGGGSFGAVQVGMLRELIGLKNALPDQNVRARIKGQRD